MEKENPHAGHRERQTQKFVQQGLDAFTDVEAVELLLYYAIPRRDTNVLAHRLLDRFHGLPGLLEAPRSALVELEGVGEHTASLICLVRELNQRYLNAERKLGEQLTDTEAVGRYLRSLFSYRKEEIVALLCLDSGSRVLSCHVLAEGHSAAVQFSVRNTVELCLRENAARVVLAHNHLSGTALPSSTDLATTRQLQQALRLIGVELADHLIFSEGDFVSLRESRAL